MDDPFVLIVHGFEGFGRDAIKAGCFSLLEFGNGTFDFVEGDWGVNFGEAWLLGNEVKNSVINWSVLERGNDTLSVVVARHYLISP